MRAGSHKAFAFFSRHYPKLLLAGLATVISSLLLGTSIGTIILAVFLILAASFSTFYFNYVSAPVNFELVKLSTVLMAYTHGIAAGLLVGVSATIIGKVLIGRIDEKLPISVAAISIVAVIAGLFSGADLATLGIALVGAYNLAMAAVNLGMGGDIGWTLPYEGSNFAINFLLFTRIAPLLLPLLQ